MFSKHVHTYTNPSKKQTPQILTTRFSYDHATCNAIYVCCRHFPKNIVTNKTRGIIPLTGHLHKIFLILVHGRGLNKIRLVSSESKRTRIPTGIVCVRPWNNMIYGSRVYFTDERIRWNQLTRLVNYDCKLHINCLCKTRTYNYNFIVWQLHTCTMYIHTHTHINKHWLLH